MWGISLFSPRFLPRDAMCKRGLCYRPASVCPSVTLVYCIHTAEDIVKLLSRPVSPIILVFWPQHRYPIPRGTPSAGAQNTRGWNLIFFAIFDWNRRLSRKRYEIGPWLLCCYGTLVRVIGGRSICVGSDNLQWPLSRISRSQHFCSRISNLRDKFTIAH